MYPMISTTTTQAARVRVVAIDGVRAILKTESGTMRAVACANLPIGARLHDWIVATPDGVLLLERPGGDDQAADQALLDKLIVGAVASIAVALGLSRERAAFELAAGVQHLLQRRTI